MYQFSLQWFCAAVQYQDGCTYSLVLQALASLKTLMHQDFRLWLTHFKNLSDYYMYNLFQKLSENGTTATQKITKLGASRPLKTRKRPTLTQASRPPPAIVGRGLLHHEHEKDNLVLKNIQGMAENPKPNHRHLEQVSAATAPEAFF